MEVASVKTVDKSVALAVLEKYLESKELLYASIQNLDGEYSVEVAIPTDDPDDED